MIDLFTAELNTLSNENLYAAIADFAKAQPNESNRHDFKSIWTSDTVKHVAAFANTFGGLLIVGVEKGKADSEATAVGVPSPSEIATGIASSIATGISPTPSYDIAECYKPGGPNRRFCVVRIRTGTTFYLVTKKGLVPAWVRNADQSVPADAAQLRSLIDREEHSAEATNEFLLERAQSILKEMPIGFGYSDIEAWDMGGWHRSENYFNLALVPAERRWARLDVFDEDRFAGLIHGHYRRVKDNLGRAARDAVNRSGDFFEYRWYHQNISHENRWRVTSRLEIAHAVQIKHDAEWSLVDVVMYTILLLTIGAKWWKSYNYFGDGLLVASIGVNSLKLARGKASQFIPLFKPFEGDFGMRSEVLQEHAQRDVSLVFMPVNAATITERIPQLVTEIMNPLLRSLGHGVSYSAFEENVQIITEGFRLKIQ
jgi:hypothetical protein